VKKMMILIVLMLTAAAIAADPLSVSEVQQLSQEAASLFTTQAAAVATGAAAPGKCAAPLFVSLALGRQKGNASMALGPYDRQDTMSLSYSTTHFKLHFTSTGDNAVYQFNVQDSISGVPNFVFEAGAALERAYRHYTEDLGFGAPLSDASYNGGGDGRLDIYFINFGAYGATVPESLKISGSGCTVSTSYMFLENDYSGFPGYQNDRFSPLRVTCAHELFHMFQFALDVGEIEGSGADQNPAWIEMSATFMEEEMYSAVNDYYNYLPFFYDFPYWSIRTGTTRTSPQINIYKNLHMYGSVVWPLFLSRQYGSAIVKNIWDSCGAVPGPNWWLGTNGCIKARSGGADDIRSMFRLFSVWNLFTGSWARGTHYFPEAFHYPRVTFQDTASSYAFTIVPSDSLLPDNLGADYVVLTNLQSVPTGLAVSFSPDQSLPWGFMVVGVPFDTTRAVFVDPTIYDSATALIQIPNSADFDRVLLMPMILDGNGLQGHYSMTISPLGKGVLTPNGGEHLYAGQQFLISWNLPDTIYHATDLTAKIELSINDGLSWQDPPIAYVKSQSRSGSYLWTVPHFLSDSCLIRVSDSIHPAIFDTSNSVFSIVSHDVNTVYEPYPNPAWVQHAQDQGESFYVHFKADLTINAGSGTYMTVAILTLAGEKVIELPLNPKPEQGQAIVTWDFKNKSGKYVAAGPYLAVIKLSGDSKTYIKKFMVMR